MASHAGKKQSQTSRLIALEPRFVFDGALVADVEEAIAEASASQADAPAPVHAADDLARAAEAQVASRTAQEAPGDGEDTATADTLAFNGEVAFVDASLPDLDTLLADIPDGTRVFMLDADRDGMAQMVEAMRGLSDVSAVHILTHGEPGELQLGSATLNAETMSTLYRSALASIGANLTADADILIYGCDFTAGADGLATASLLAEITGADVAGSNDVTGHGDLGGNWDLETTVGEIEAQSIEAEGWHSTLQVVPSTNLDFSGTPTIEATGAPVTGTTTFAVNDVFRFSNVGSFADGNGNTITVDALV
ncbi:MAG: DUF4347 domain-containing protein, partial [Pseudomonadota bacterium]